MTPFGSTPMTLAQPVNGINTFAGSMDILDALTKTVISTTRVTISTDQSIASSFQVPHPLPTYPMRLLVKITLSGLPVPVVVQKEITVNPVAIDILSSDPSVAVKTITTNQVLSLSWPSFGPSTLSTTAASYRLALTAVSPLMQEMLHDPVTAPNLLMGRVSDRFFYVLQENILATTVTTLQSVAVPASSFPAVPRGSFYHIALLARNNATVARSKPVYLGLVSTETSMTGPVLKDVPAGSGPLSLNIGTNVPPQMNARSTAPVPAVVDMVVHSRPVVNADGSMTSKAIARIPNALPLATLTLPTTTTLDGANVPTVTSAFLNFEPLAFADFLTRLRASMPPDAPALPFTLASYADVGPIRIVVRATANTLVPAEPAIIPHVIAIREANMPPAPSPMAPPTDPSAPSPSFTAMPTKIAPPSPPPTQMPIPTMPFPIPSIPVPVPSMPVPLPTGAPMPPTGDRVFIAVSGLTPPPTDPTSSTTYFPGVLTLGQLVQVELGLVLPAVAGSEAPGDYTAAAHVELCRFDEKMDDSAPAPSPSPAAAGSDDDGLGGSSSSSAESGAADFETTMHRGLCSRITINPLRLGLANRRFQLRLWPVEGQDKLGGAFTFGMPFFIRAHANLTAGLINVRLHSMELPLLLQQRPKAALRTDPLIPASGGSFAPGQTFSVYVALPLGMPNPFNADGTTNPTPAPPVPPTAVVLMSSMSARPVRVLAGPEAIRAAMALSPMLLTFKATLTQEDLMFVQPAIYPPPPPPRFWIQAQFPASIFSMPTADGSATSGGALPFTIPAAVLDTDAFIPASAAPSPGTVDPVLPSSSPVPSASRTAAPSRFPQPSAWPTRPVLPSRSPYPTRPVAPSKAPIAPSFSAPPTRRPGESPKPTTATASDGTTSSTGVVINGGVQPAPSAPPMLPVMELQLGIRLSSSVKDSPQAATIISKIVAAITNSGVGKTIRERIASLIRKDVAQVAIATIVETASKRRQNLNVTSPCNRMPRPATTTTTTTATGTTSTTTMGAPAPTGTTNTGTTATSSTGPATTIASLLETIMERIEGDDRPRVCVPELSRVFQSMSVSTTTSTTTSTATTGAAGEPDIKIGIAVSLRVPSECAAFSTTMRGIADSLNNAASREDIWPEGDASASASFAAGRRRNLQTTSSGDLTLGYDGIESDFTSAADTLSNADLSDITADVALNAGLNPSDVQFAVAAQPALAYAPPPAAPTPAPQNNAGSSSSGSSNGGAIAAGLIVTGLVVVGAFFVVRKYRRDRGMGPKKQGVVRRTSVAGQGTFNPLNSPVVVVTSSPMGTQNPMLVLGSGVGNNGLAMMNGAPRNSGIVMHTPMPGTAQSMHNATLASGHVFRADDAASSRATFQPFRASFAASGPRASGYAKGTSV